MPQETHAESVFDLLEKDHRLVERLFSQFESAEEGADKVELARTICLELTIHAEAEEKAFYPAAREVLGHEGDDLVREAMVEHASLKKLIAAIDGSGPKMDLFGAQVKVLEEYVKHHVKEEENELFPKLREADGFDPVAVGEKLAAAKVRLEKRAEGSPSRGKGTIVHVPSLRATPAKPAAKKNATKSKKRAA